jgi:hypothetical protein
MADVQDTITTVLRVTGMGQMAAQFNQATNLLKSFGLAQEATGMAGVRLAEIQSRLKSETAAVASIREFAIMATKGLSAAEAAANPIVLQLAEAETAAAAAAGELAAAELAALTPLLLIVGAIAIMVAQLAIATKGLQEFGKEQEALFRAQNVYRNVGLNPASIQPQAAAISRATAFQGQDVIAEQAKLAATGLNQAQIGPALMAIANLSRGTGKSFEEAGNALEKGVLGKTKGLAAFRIQLEATTSRAQNLSNILQQVDKRYRGMAEGFKDTLPGAVLDFQRSLHDLFKAIGSEFAPAAIRLLHLLTGVVDWVATHIVEVIATINPLLGLLAAAIGYKYTPPNPMSVAGQGGDPAKDTENLNEINDNLKGMPDFIKHVIGGTGAFKTEFATGAVQHAMMI